jgi:hypothetical protein
MTDVRAWVMGEKLVKIRTVRRCQPKNHELRIAGSAV